jgi:hypothetical protein
VLLAPMGAAKAMPATVAMDLRMTGLLLRSMVVGCCRFTVHGSAPTTLQKRFNDQPA